MTTIETIKHQQITTLRREALNAGDQATVTDCDLVLEQYDTLDADPTAEVFTAANRLVVAIRNAEAQAEETDDCSLVDCSEDTGLPYPHA